MLPEITIDAKGVVRAARIAWRAQRVLKVFGGSGAGKSEIIQQIVAQFEAEAGDEPFFYTTFNAALALGPDISGFLLPFERQHTTFDGKETFTLREGAYTYPHFLRDKRTGEPAAKFKIGVIVLEEWGQANTDAKKMLTPAMWDYFVGEHKIPRGIRMILLSNRPKDRSAVTKEFDFSINRWIEVHYQPTIEGFNEHFRTSGKRLHPDIAEWINNGENADVFSGEPPKDQAPWATSRSIETMSEVLYEAEALGFNETEHVTFAMLCGSVGMGKAASFRDNRKMAGKLPTYDEVVKNPLKAKVPSDSKEDMSACYIIVHRLANKMRFDDAENLVKYIERLPQSFGVTFVKAIMDRDPKKALFLNEHIMKWSAKNGDVLAAINKYKPKV